MHRLSGAFQTIIVCDDTPKYVEDGIESTTSLGQAARIPALNKSHYADANNSNILMSQFPTWTTVETLADSNEHLLQNGKSPWLPTGGWYGGRLPWRPYNGAKGRFQLYLTWNVIYLQGLANCHAQIKQRMYVILFCIQRRKAQYNDVWKTRLLCDRNIVVFN